MNTNAKEQMATRRGSRPASAERRLKELGIKFKERNGSPASADMSTSVPVFRRTRLGTRFRTRAKSFNSPP